MGNDKNFKMSPEVLMALFALLLQYGLPAVISIIQSFEKEEITMEDIAGLKGLAKPPETY